VSVRKTRSDPTRACLDELVLRTATAFGVRRGDIFRHKRSKSIADARHVVLWVAYTTWQPRPSLTELGALLGGFRHSTASDAVARIDGEVTARTPLGRTASAVAGPPIVDDATAWLRMRLLIKKAGIGSKLSIEPLSSEMYRCELKIGQESFTAISPDIDSVIDIILRSAAAEPEPTTTTDHEERRLRS